MVRNKGSIRIESGAICVPDLCAQFKFSNGFESRMQLKSSSAKCRMTSAPKSRTHISLNAMPFLYWKSLNKIVCLFLKFKIYLKRIKFSYRFILVGSILVVHILVT